MKNADTSNLSAKWQDSALLFIPNLGVTCVFFKPYILKIMLDSGGNIQWHSTVENSLAVWLFLKMLTPRYVPTSAESRGLEQMLAHQCL